MFFVVAYDIADDRRRNRVAKILEDYGDRVQESVFEMILDTDARYVALYARLESAIDPAADRIRVYRLCSACERSLIWLGLGTRTQDEPFIVL